MNNVAVGYGLLAAMLFGLATPAAKLLIGTIDPWMLAGLLYGGSGLGLALLRFGLRRRGPAGEASLMRQDAPWLSGAILTGGIVAPLLLMAGLTMTSGSTSSLLLSLEGVATAAIAWFVFGENFNRRVIVGMGLIVAGAALLAWRGPAQLGEALGPALIAAACLAWAIDNNLTRKVSLSDPLQIAMLKGLVAGPVNLGLGFALGAVLPPPAGLVLAGVVGFLGYGVSLALFVVALRHLGAARTSAYFATAPFIGAAAAVPLLNEPLSLQLIAAGMLMAAGVWLHLTERHDHEHVHVPFEHTHRHVHDEHHQHVHAPGDPPGEPHVHRHSHARLRHSHPHVPDAHHRHSH